MATKKHGLGRGLDALLAPVEPEKTESGGLTVPLSKIDTNPDQPRKNLDPEKIRELADSIAIHGVLQPLLVLPKGSRYMIIAGERRFRAARLAGLKEVPVIVREFDEQQLAEVALVENLQRDDLNAIEEAMGIRSLIQTFSLTQEQVGERLGMSRPAIANALRLLNLPESVQEALQDGRLTAGHGRALAGIADKSVAEALAQRAIAEGMTVRQLEAEVAKLSKAEPEKPVARKEPKDSEFGELEEKLMHAMGTKVQVKGSMKKGRIVVEYYSRDDLERIYALADKWALEE